MKRTTVSVASLLLISILCAPFEAHGLESALSGGRYAFPVSGQRVDIPAGLKAISTLDPADLGGIRILQDGRILSVPFIESGASLGLPKSILSSARILNPASAIKIAPTAFQTAEHLAAPQDESGPRVPDQKAADKVYDGKLSAGEAGTGGGGPVGGGNGAPQDQNNDGGTLGKLYPRVVMVLDTLEGPASDKLVGAIETLIDKKVHVLFVTPRPEKGENSAESVLISKLKVRSGNPVIVVSYNGARIRTHNSHAENPKPLPGLDDEPGFPENTIATFRRVNTAMKAKFGIRGELKEFRMPDAETPYIYGAELPKNVDAAEFKRAYNRALDGQGLNYKIETVEEGGRTAFFTQSTALKLNTGRIFKALYAQYPELDPAQGSGVELKPEQMLVLADSTRANNFLKSLPGNGYYIHGVKDGAGLEEALSALLGNSALEKVTVIRSQLRAYTDWLEARAKYGSPREIGGGGGAGFRLPASHSRYYRDLGFFRGILIYDLMGRLYHYMRKGQYPEASPEAAEKLLERMWYNPRGMGVRISDEMEAVRHTGRWKSLQRGYLDISKRWLRNYYNRNFKDYPINVSEQVVGTMINLARDSKNSIVVEYVSPYTGRRYVVHLLPARAHLERDDKGNILVAHVYRTGKEPFETEFEDSIEKNLLARAMLEGYADKRADGRWYVNDEADPRVKVVFHYNTRDLSDIQTTAEVESHQADVTAMIEKMLADKEFIAHWEEQEAKNNKVTANAGKAKSKPKPGKKTKKS